MNLILAIALMVVFALVGAGGGYFYRKNMAEKRIGRTEEYAKKLLDDATRKAAETKKEMEIEAKGAKVYFLLQSEKSVLEEELSGLTLPFDIICDPAMKIYEALDIQPAESMKALLGDGLEKLQAKGAAAAEAGFSHGKYEGNEQQLPALFIVDAAGKVLTAHYARDIMDMPTIDEVLAQL